jgi:hypothetical protein
MRIKRGGLVRQWIIREEFGQHHDRPTTALSASAWSVLGENATHVRVFEMVRTCSALTTPSSAIPSSLLRNTVWLGYIFWKFSTLDMGRTSHSD